MEPYLLFSLIYFKMVRLLRADCLSVRFIGNSLSLEILLAIDNFQYTVTNTYTLSEFENIGPSHMKANKLGYDGSCFPKDMEAFANFLDSELLKSVIKVNESLVSSR